MTDARQAAWRPPRAAVRRRRQRRWAVGAVAAAGWLLLLVVTGSALDATVLLLLLAALVLCGVAGLRSLGPGSGYPGLRPRGAPAEPGPGDPWAPGGRDPWAPAGRDPWAPGGRDDPGALAGREEQWALDRPPGSQAAAGDDDPWTGRQLRVPASRRVQADAEVVTARLAASAAPPAAGPPTIAEWHRPEIPTLRLVTGDWVTQTQTSGARAGRGAVDLVLPQVPTVSREHARFTFARGEWWIANLGRNGLTLNGVPLTGDHMLRDGDSIRWGRSPDALMSRVEIG